jgi:nitroreductase
VGRKRFIKRLGQLCAMSVLDVILSRRSIRHYEDKEIPKDVLDKIAEAGRQSPSAANRQPYRFVIVTDSEIKKEVSGLLSRFLKNTPAIIVGCADQKSLLTGKWAVVDTAIALENMVLAAWSLGVGSCWVGSFDEQKVKNALHIPQDWKVVALVALGYPVEKPKQRKRKDTTELFGENQF